MLILPSYIGMHINFAIVTKQEDYVLSITMDPCPVGASDLYIRQAVVSHGQEKLNRRI